MERTLETAIVLVLRDAAPFDAVLAEFNPSTFGKGIPFHITLLYPFAARDDLTDALVMDVRAFFAARAPLAFALTRIEEFPGVIYAAPEPVDPMRATMHALHAHFPDLPPYGGVFEEVILHATLTEEPADQQRIGNEIERRLAPHLPREIRLDAATLLAEFELDRWREREEFPLGG